MNTDSQPRHFASHLLDDMRSQRASREQSKRGQPALDWVESVLHQAVHFVMPEGGRLFDDGRRALDVDARLAYPVVALEYGINMAADNRLFGELMLACPERVAIGVDFRQYASRPSWMVAWEWELQRRNFDINNCILAMSAAKLDGSWLVVPAAICFDTSKFHDERSIREESKKPNPTFQLLQSGGWNGSLSKGGYASMIMPLVPEYLEALVRQDGQLKAYARVMADLNDEELAVLEFIEAMSCSNVRAEVSSPAPKFLNKKRAKKGKTPIFEYRTLTIDLPQPQTIRGEESLPSGRASPRIHLRRGHVRRLPEKKIWVNAAVIGSKEKGVVHKDYGLNMRAQQ